MTVTSTNNAARRQSRDLDRQNRLLERVGINRDVKGISVEKLYRAIAHDKKVSGGCIRFVLADGIGSVGVYDDITKKEIEDGITYMFEYAGL